jgi:hypothetical protein
MRVRILKVVVVLTGKLARVGSDISKLLRERHRVSAVAATSPSAGDEAGEDAGGRVQDDARGEEGGRLAEMIHELADHYAEETSYSVEAREQAGAAVHHHHHDPDRVPGRHRVRDDDVDDPGGDAVNRRTGSELAPPARSLPPPSPLSPLLPRGLIQGPNVLAARPGSGTGPPRS